MNTKQGRMCTLIIQTASLILEYFWENVRGHLARGDACTWLAAFPAAASHYCVEESLETPPGGSGI